MTGDYDLLVQENLDLRRECADWRSRAEALAHRLRQQEMRAERLEEHIGDVAARLPPAPIVVHGLAPSVIVKAETDSWNAAMEAAALKAEEEAAALRADLPAFSSTAGVMDEAEAVALESFAKTIRALKRGQS